MDCFLFSLELSENDLWKVGMFLLVQALVYIVLSKSSNIFSSSRMRSLSFQTVRSPSLQRMLEMFSDPPLAAELGSLRPAEPPRN
ncbi:hypothetical protein MA16_Dca011943 [Dendrobium catenatum]|uniref:Uncharacterized protein n=1 Tax=Dendrobium catenatum TaxID=906689 RepID=A0A2I0WDQ9_9ASPA|nr:hypothetical protein MA16_Dca011943 [Dendrobium catenatum]